MTPSSERARVIDADGHVEEDLGWIVERMPDDLKPLAPRFERGDNGKLVNLIEGKPWRPTYKLPRGSKTHVAAGGEPRTGGRDPAERLRVLDAEGIDAAVLFPSLGLMYGLYEDPAAAAALCQGNNDWLAAYCAADPHRLIGVALLPQQDPQRAVDELERCVEQHRFVAGVIRPNKIAGLTVDDAAFEPLWSAAAALDVPIVLHEAYFGGIDTVGEDRQRTYAGAHVISHPLEQMSAMVALCVAGVLERHPNLRLGFFEAGCGWAPYWSERIEEHFDLAPGDFAGGDPHGTLTTRTWLTFEVDEQSLPSVLELGWSDNVCYASDYPHYDAVYPGSVRAVRERGLPVEVERKILGANAERFYGSRLTQLLV
jgi:predicted TIM-barrel fold metal-dependent hydrolase